MAHDVWLLRSTLMTCLLLSALAGTAIATNENHSTDQIGSSDIKDRRFTSGAQNILIRDNSFEDGYQAKQRTTFVHDGSTSARAQVRSANMTLKDSIERLETKRNIKEGIGEPGARKTRMHILDKYFVDPEIMKEKLSDRNGPNKDEEASLSALVLQGPRSGTDGRDFGNRELGKETSNIEKYGVASVEGTKIVNAASLLENSSRSHETRLTESLEYPERNIGEIPPGTFRHYLPTQTENVLQRAKSKLRSRYRFVNSLIRPQLAGISDDLNDLDALRNRAKSVSLKTLKNSFKSRKFESGDQFNEGSASIGEYTLRGVKQKASIVKERNEGSDYNTKMKTKPRFNSNDMFLLGAPDKSSYFENVFLANPELTHSKPGLVIRPTPRWQRYRATTALKEGKILNEAFRKFGGGSDTTESGVEDFVHPEDELDSNESGLGSDANTALRLAIQSDIRLNKATSQVSLLSFKDKAMSHIEEESNDMYNERKFKEDYGARYSNSSASLEAQRANPSSYFSPTKMRDFPKATTLSSYKRTTIPHWKFGSQDVYQSSSSGSGEGSGSGEYHLPPYRSHDKQKHAQKIPKISLSKMNKTHAGIFGAQDEETVKKCERMGKADYRDKCPSGWLAFEEFCYLFVPKSNGKWEEFPLKCNDENGLLAMPKTDKELKFLQRKISSSKQRKTYFYIGLKKKKSENWTWVDDVPYTRDVHVKDQLGDKNCAALSKDGVHMVTCSEPKTGYICEIRTGVEVFRILAFGDSLTNGFHTDDKSHTPYAKTLEYLLNKDIHRCYTLTTIAKDGTEAAEMSSRLQNHLRDAKYKYSWVIILAGTNDIAHNSQTRYRKAWDTAVERIINLHITSHRYGAKTVAVTIPEMDCEESKRPACLHTHLERKYINEKLRYYARSNEFTILCDLAVKFPRYSLSSDERKLMWEVGLHMKPAGYERMAEIIYKELLANV